MADATYYRGAELNDVALTWNHPVTGLYTDFVSGWTFTVRVGEENVPAIIEKTAGITPAATAPNILIAWAPDELEPLSDGVHLADLEARHGVSGKDRKTRFTIEILPAVADAP